MLRFIGTWLVTLVAFWVLLNLFGLVAGGAAFWLLAVTAVAIVLSLLFGQIKELDALRKRIEKLEAQLPDAAEPPVEAEADDMPAAED